MTYMIAENRGTLRPVEKCRVSDMTAAEAWAYDYASRFPDDPEVIFEVDPDGHDAADIAILRSTQILLFTVERNDND